MRLYRLQSSPGNFLVATRSCHSPLPSTWATLVVERIRSECRPSLARTSVKVISPAPAKDQVERSSMLSSRRESRTFLFSQRNSAPSSYLACMGMPAAACCAMRDPPKQRTLRIVLRLKRRGFLAHPLHLDLMSTIEPMPPCFHHTTHWSPEVDLLVLSLPDLEPVSLARVEPIIQAQS